eukprot:gene12788-biopygen10693
MAYTANTSRTRSRHRPFMYTGTSFDTWDIIMTSKICGNPDLLYDIRSVKPRIVRTAAGDIKITRVGSACIQGDRGNTIILRKVYLTDSTETPNLLSYSAACLANPTMSSFLQGKTCTIMTKNPTSQPQSIEASTSSPPATLYSKAPKMDKNTYPTSDTRASAPLAIIHVDMSGMMKVPSLNGSLYFQGILDDSSKYSFSTFHKTKDTVPADTIAELKRSDRATKKPDFLSCLAASDVPIPRNEKEALFSEYSEEWIAAMTEELTALSDMKTWSLADLPPGSKAIGTKWVFDLKRLVSGEIDRFRARLEAKGYAQRPGMDYDEFFAPVAKLATIRFILSMAADPAAHLAQLDVSTAFLHGIVEEEIYCTQPPGFKKDHRVCRMWKCLYGLKQASRQWYLKVKEDMMGIGFKEVDVDQGLFILPGKSNRPLIWVLLWVDDFLLLSFDEKVLLQYKTAIMALNKTRDLGELSVFVGYEITRNRAAGTLHICQSRFIKQLLKSHNMLAEPASTRFPIPLQPDAMLPYHEAGTPKPGLPLAQIVGSLNYLAVNTRPDIAQAVNRLARHSAHPLHDHMEAATGILKYLATTPDHGITYTSSKKLLTRYCDSDQAACPITRKSTTGWVFLNQGGAIAWASKIQSSATALSSTEAAYMAASSAAQEAMWLRKLQFCATGIQPPALTINRDNQAALSAWNQEKMSTRLRHKDTRFHFLKEESKKQSIRLNWIPTAANMADMFTKALPRNEFCDFRTQIGCLGNPHKPL